MQYRHQRTFQGFVHGGHAFGHQPRFQGAVQTPGVIGILGGIIQSLVQRHPVEGHLAFAGPRHFFVLDGGVGEMQFRQFVEAVTVQAAFQHIGQQHGVVDGADGDAVTGQHFHIVFDVMPDFLGARILQQGFQGIQSLIEGHLLRRFAIGGAVTAVAQVKSSLFHRPLVVERDITGPAGFKGQRHADQFRLHGVQRGGFRIDGNDAFLAGPGNPLLQSAQVLDKLVGRRRLLRRFRRPLPDGRLKAVAAADPFRQFLEVLGGEKIQQVVPVRLLDGEIIQGHFDGNVGFQGNQLFRNAGVVGMVDQALPTLRLLDVFGMGQHVFQVAVLNNKLRRRLRTNAGHARYVVR